MGAVKDVCVGARVAVRVGGGVVLAVGGAGLAVAVGDPLAGSPQARLARIKTINAIVAFMTASIPIQGRAFAGFPLPPWRVGEEIKPGQAPGEDQKFAQGQQP